MDGSASVRRFDANSARRCSSLLQGKRNQRQNGERVFGKGCQECFISFINKTEEHFVLLVRPGGPLKAIIIPAFYSFQSNTR